MNETTSSRPPQRASDAQAFVANMTRAFDLSAQIASLLAGAGARAMNSDEINPVTAFADSLQQMASDYMAHPERALEAQFKLWQGHARLWQNTWKRFLGEDVDPVVHPDRADRRFKDPEWETNQVFDLLKQSYLITAHWAHGLVEEAPELSPHDRHKARFFIDQVANALSPSNFALTNPEVLRLTLESNGQNLVDGLSNLLRDLEDSGGELRIRQTDLDAFEVGKNLATTPGKVVYQNDVMQLIQYAPTTKEVYETPLVIVPPWINKFYILDLNEKKSFIRWAVAQGLTVFVVSWVNPDQDLAQKTFADYMREGILAAVEKACEACDVEKVNAIGYCVGGTLLASTLGYLAATGDERINSATFFTTQVDFTQAGDLCVFVDEAQIEALEKEMAHKGYLEGKKMAGAFNMLRSNDLIWSYVVNNYLKGKEPLPFDLLYWNSDSTRMPAALHSFYLRQCYLDNNLSQGKMVLDGVKVDLGKVTTPVYNLATREDHIAPLPSVFKVGRFLGGETRLVVAGSGHIAGVVNPPEAHKYQYWTNENGADTLEDWLAGADEHAGSWWPDWAKWIGARSGKKVAARKPGGGKLKPIEDAPGSYVKVRAD